MRKILLLVLIPCAIHSQNRNTVRELQKGKIHEDTSYVYQLPFLQNEKYLMVQGYYTQYSHKHLVANDFKMPENSTICAARTGTVVAAYDKSDTGGLKDKANHWNYVVIQHEDSSTAIYGHLQKDGLYAKLGDTVLEGQPLAKSGNTGYSAFPHLHFAVFDKNGNQIPVRFYTDKGAMYLAQWKKYGAINKKKK